MTFRPATLFAFLLAALSLNAETFYVRTDGGSDQQCTGKADAAYPGSGTAQPCAWDHPFRAMPPESAPRISGGDTVVIAAGSYMMGAGAPGADASVCDPSAAWTCHMPPVPGGPDASHPTRFVGAGWSSGCAAKPQLWGAERADFVVDMTDSSNVVLACLEITDHSDCVEYHSGSLPCERDTAPFGNWAVTGIYAEDSSNVTLSDLDIHGLAATGVAAGRLKDWTVTDVRIAGNGWAGWNGDIDGDDSNSGTMRFTRWTVAWNGCGETYPGRQPVGCWAQTAGGYGDGVGTGETQGHWIIEDSAFLYNTSDGLDLLYARAGSQIEIRRTKAIGNAGNQLKTNGPTTIENAIVVGNCGFFEGKSFTLNVDPCRAVGNVLSLNLRSGDAVTVVNSTVTGEGDCLVLAECDEGSTCGSSEKVTLRNDIFEGQTDFLQPFEQTCLAYQETFTGNPFVFESSIINHVKDDDCPATTAICGLEAGLTSTLLANFDAHLTSGSRAIDAGTATGAPKADFDGKLRDAKPDIGAYEYGGQTAAGRKRAIRR